MAETSKLLNPDKTVLIPDMRAGCSLAESITGADVRLLRERYPGVPVVTYVNTSAEVKAESDICCTSANAVQVVESLGSRHRALHPRRIPRHERRAQTTSQDPHLEGRTAKCTSASPPQELLAYKEADPGDPDRCAPRMPARRDRRSAISPVRPSGMIDYVKDERRRRCCS